MSRRQQPSIYPPSVGELLDRADLMARGLLYDAPDRDGRAMLRAWGEVVEGAGEVWRQLPHRSDVSGTAKDVIDQLERSARTLHRSAGSTSIVDPAVQEIGQVFTQAADLIAGSGVSERREPDRWTAAQLRDVFAARVHIMHTLYLASHAVAVGLANTALQERFDPRLRIYAVSAAELRQQLLGVEQIAHTYVNGHYPHALAGRHREPPDDRRIPGAIASWDIHAQRALTRAPTADVLARVAGSAFIASTHAHRLWRAAVEARHVDARLFDQQIKPALETMIESWGQAHARFQALTHPHDVSPRVLREASWELVNALREPSTAHRLGPAGAAGIAGRVPAVPCASGWGETPQLIRF